MLKVVADLPEPSSPGPPSPPKPKDDPRVVALLQRLTPGMAASNVTILIADEVNVLRQGLCGLSFTDADLEAIEAWIHEHVLFQPSKQSRADYVRGLNALVEQKLQEVENPRWLMEPLHVFTRLIDTVAKKYDAGLKRQTLRAIFVAFLTIRA